MTATDDLITNHREYVRKLAREIQRKLPSHALFEDLVGYGEVGLVEAANNFDPMSGVAFTTFAYYRIRGAIFDGLGKMTGLTPALRRRMRQEAGMDEVAVNTHVPGAPGSSPGSPGDDPEALAGAVQSAVGQLGAVFLMAQAGEEAGALEPVDDEDQPDEAAETSELCAKMKALIPTLPEPQDTIIQQFYFENKTMTEIAQMLSVNKATVSRHHAKALEALASALGGR